MGLSDVGRDFLPRRFPISKGLELLGPAVMWGKVNSSGCWHAIFSRLPDNLDTRFRQAKW